ncbi:hypothetical protein EBU94_02235 [bacterium]|nr:hypothetical protein [bacterium]
MKVKIGKTITDVSEDLIATNIANKLISGAYFMSDTVKNFKQSFDIFKMMSVDFIKTKEKNFIFSFSEDFWFEEFKVFQEKRLVAFQNELSLVFSDGSEWSIPLMDLANIAMKYDEWKDRDLFELLENPEDLCLWAEKKLNWDDVKQYKKLISIEDHDEIYSEEWKKVKKTIVCLKNDKK